VTPADRQTLARKLEYLRKQLDTLEPSRSLPKDTILSNPEKRLAVERLLELCLQSVIDIGRLLVTLEDWRKIRDERDAFLILAEHHVISAELADRMLQAKGFRNVLVHEYVAIDPALLMAHLMGDVDDLWTFAKGIAKQL